MMFKIQHYILKQVMITAILSIVEMIHGFSVSWSASMVQKLLEINKTPLPRIITNEERSWITNIIFLGCTGGFVSSYLCNRIGRRYSYILGGFTNCFTYLLLTFAVSANMMIVGRFLVGFHLCFMQVLTCTYVGEVAPPKIRGTIMTILSVFQCIGCQLGFCLGPYISFVQFGAVPIAFTMIFFFLSFCLHESPVYYVIKGNEKEARQALEYFGCNNDIDEELMNIIASAKELELENKKWLEIFNKINRKALFIVIPVYFIQQASGVIAVMLNATAIFKVAGSSVEPAVATMIVGATNLIGSLVSPFVVDRYGRRFLLFISTGGCSLTMAILGTYFYFREVSPDSVASLGWLPLTALVGALFTYSVGLTIIPHTLAGEMFSPNMRGLGSSIGITAGNITGLITTSIYDYLVLSVGIHIAFWMFTVFDIFGIFFTAFAVPDTTGKSLTEINTMLRE